MTDYTQPADVLKRVRFFDGQFLQDQDFVDEQKFHLDRQRRLARLLGFAGIADGLGVRAGSAPYTVTVAAGTAVDSMGRQLVLPAAVTLTLPAADFGKRQGISVVVGYREVTTDLAQTGSKNERRFDETPVVAAISPEGVVTVAPAGAAAQIDPAAVQLATLSVTDTGAVTVAQPSSSVAGLRGLGSVGIGTEQPVSKLEVVGGGGSSIDLTVNGRLRSNNDDGGLWINQDRFVGGTGNQVGFFTNGGWALTVTKDGNVGIGTGVAGPLNTENWNRVVDILGTAHARVRMRSNAIRAFAGAHDIGGYSGAPGGMLAGTETAHPISLVTSSLHRLTITATGDVGIGTPTVENLDGWGRTLEVSSGATGSATRLTLRTSKVESRIMAHDTGYYGSGPGMIIGTATTSALYLATSKTTRLTVTSDGKVGIGKTNPVSSLEIGSQGGTTIDLTIGGRIQTNSTDGGILIGTDRFVGGCNTDQIGFWSGKQWNLIVDRTGKVGIGTTAPTARLEIASGATDPGSIDLMIGQRIKSKNSQGGMHIGDRALVGGTSGDRLGFWTAGGGWALTQTQSGQVVIGNDSTDPGNNRLYVGQGGSITAEGDVYTKGSFWAGFNINLGTNARVGTLISNRLGFWTKGGGWALTQTQAGQVVIGDENTNPGNHKLYVGKGGSVYVEGETWVKGGMRYFWGVDGNWYDIQHGNGVAATQQITYPSDLRLKTDLRPIGGALAAVQKLSGTRFRWGSEGLDHLTRDVEHEYPAGPKGSEQEQEAGRQVRRAERQAELGGEQLGLIAQEVEQVLPELVTTGQNGYLQVNYGHLTAVLVEAIKEQQTSIEELRSLIQPVP